MGTWYDDNGNIYSAMADIGRDQYRERFRCMVSRRNVTAGRCVKPTSLFVFAIYSAVSVSLCTISDRQFVNNLVNSSCVIG